MKVNCDDIGIEKAIQIVKQGGIVIFPTDTVYGIGCDPYNKESVKKVYNLKSREFSKPFPILVDSKETAKKIVEFDEITEKITEKFWPGPLTIILKLTDDKLKKSLNLEEKIAIRIPNNKCTLKLLKKCNFLVGTSANISNQKSVSDPNECLKNMQDFDVFIDGGIIDSKGESTIIEIEDEKIKIIREGSLSKNEIIKC
ncbi:MAG: threonylcarbamoyl-AMP synthase [Thaumarchaeota archaeon]|nr:threonylcarbamoyl-AMP synthase [Nitrososphaerota archaeon]MBT6468264.1 threonylcarbamoyl-AMP synthase [Nitrososphaerota archaeon]